MSSNIQIFGKEQFNTLLNNIDSTPLKWVSNNFKATIEKVVSNFFPNLNLEDQRVIKILSVFIIDLISFKYNFEKNENYEYQWIQNNFRDMKGAILLLLPFIDDKNGGHLLNKIEDLNQLLYAYKTKTIPKEVNDLHRESILSTHFEFGNMGIGLIENKDNNDLLNLYENNTKLIYKVIYHNFIGLLQTLEIINGKCYINWVNIVPLNLQNYTDSNIFIKTKEKMNFLKPIVDKINFQEFNSKNLINYNGLWLGDIYNILRIKYYEEAKPIKWLFFPYETENTKIYLINGIDKMIDLNPILNSSYNDYNDLPKVEQFNFEKKILELITKLKMNIPTNEYLEIDVEILKYTLIYLINNYSQKSKLKGTTFNKFVLKAPDSTDENNEDFNKDDFKIINDINISDIIDAFQYIVTNNLDNFWNFIKESIEELLNTCYGKFLIKKENNLFSMTNKYFYEPFNQAFKDSEEFKLVNKNLNIKNIYNIAKSLSHYTSKDWTLLNKNYLSLNDVTRKMFFIKILQGVIFNKATNQWDVNLSSWINLKGNLRRQYYGVSYDYDATMIKIFSGFQTIFINLVFEELASTGILNKFVLNRDITDKLILPLDYGPRKSKVKNLIDKNFEKNKDEWLDSYYYLTNDTFRNLPKMRLDKEKVLSDDDKYDEMSWFKIISKDQEWPIFYAMDWVSQISFFQHYIYHQVMYVTGATGQGKSTQVPKLLLYALKAIDYKSNGKVICTQPRVPPTVGNATRIADELGLSIEQTANGLSTKIKTNNYWVQYKHQSDSHLNTKKLHSFLRIVTDGTLLEELKNNPTLLQPIPKSGNPDFQYINKNIYDIVIVDEAHEHNPNMDIIIALTKQACFYNNTVRLIVVSATMDEDEPIYRRYFKNLNDNLLFPIKIAITDPFLNLSSAQYLLPNAMLMDIRYHISPPGETTQYRVDEFYLDDDPIGKDERTSAKLAQEIGYKKIEDICKKTSTGEILFFANGKKEILDAVEHLNSVLPPGNVALPYFSELHDNYKTMISKINLKISQIKNKRENIHLEWGSDYIEDLSVPSGMYKRSVIVATNVAEASVTINGLAFVVDNGFAKVNRYQPQVNKTVLEVQKISEASRLQRKGRVGRVGDGTVYYMYKKDARKTIRPQYKITQDNVALTMLGLMCTKEISEIKNKTKDFENLNKLIVSIKMTPNRLLFYQNIESDSKINCFTVNSSLHSIYQENYRLDK